MRRTAPTLLLLLSLVACKDREQEARETGEAVRAVVASRCASDAGAPEGDGACAREACSAACVKYAEMATFQRACVAACVANAHCATDADCGRGLSCVAIAPRVRRCGVPAAPLRPAPSP
jgi:hypothetical protein